MKTRIEHDPLGKKEVPAEAYYGIHTQRAFENFPISGTRVEQELIRAIAMIKLAACRANHSLGLLDTKKAQAIERAAQEVIGGLFDEQFILDVYQAGAGTATHMNINEVIANRAIELLDGKRGDYGIIHPNDDVNEGQSTNDVFPSAIRIACLYLINELFAALEKLEDSFGRKATDFDKIVKSGRTHLRDAVPIRFGQVIGAWAAALAEQRMMVVETTKRIRQLNLGGTAVGTGINTHPRYRVRVIHELKKITQIPVESAANLVHETQSMGDFVFLSGVLRGIAVELTRIANDMRLLSSGPRTGLNELILPAVEPGSSIMPGKVNPSMAEMLNMVCFQVIGNDHVVALAGQAGQLELNVMMPLVSHTLVQSLKLLTHAVTAFDERCVRGMGVNKKACAYYFGYGLGLAALLSPVIGYEKAAAVAHMALREKKTIRQVVLEQRLMSAVELDKMLTPSNVTRPNASRKRII